ncbi:hypothetical protein [Cohnella silvisoli]|uniref:Uncharacterized protein n=1 Tax=Cohnella silvisoli TaxID=2873699 RepID=A0ABV1KYV7_9BACL|nr:hypothetical protein [Cohnella silvisoli]MCD9024286.1 hypothetical protein [Cohnella silvisoli]
MTDNNQNDDAQKVKLTAEMPDDNERSDDPQENEFLFPPIHPHYRNDSE